MNNSKQLTGRSIGTVAGAVLLLVLWLIPHPPYNLFVVLAISFLPLVFGLLGDYIQRRYFSE